MDYETDSYPTLGLEFSNMVAELAKNPRDILLTIDEKKVDVLHATFGISGEAGELLDSIKKWVIYNKPLDVNNIYEELGDIEFYLEQLRQSLHIAREDTLEQTITKLRKRYPSGYTDEHAQERLDKIGE